MSVCLFGQSQVRSAARKTSVRAGIVVGGGGGGGSSGNHSHLRKGRLDLKICRPVSSCLCVCVCVCVSGYVRRFTLYKCKKKMRKNRPQSLLARAPSSFFLYILAGLLMRVTHKKHVFVQTKWARKDGFIFVICLDSASNVSSLTIYANWQQQFVLMLLCYYVQINQFIITCCVHYMYNHQWSVTANNNTTMIIVIEF